MKTKRTIGIIITAIFVIAMAFTSFATPCRWNRCFFKHQIAKSFSDSISIGGVQLPSGKYITPKLEVVDKEPTDGEYAYYKDGVLTLYNFYIDTLDDTKEISNGIDAGSKDLRIIISGSTDGKHTKYENNIITLTNAKNNGITCGNLEIMSDLNCGLILSVSGDELTSNGIKCKNLGIKSETYLSINADGNGIECDTFTYSTEDACSIKLSAGDNCSGIKATGDVNINVLPGGDKPNVTIEAALNGIYSNSDIIIKSGEINVEGANELGIKADKALVIGEITPPGKLPDGEIHLYLEGTDKALSGESILISIGKGDLDIEEAATGMSADKNVTIHDGTIEIASAATGIVVENGSPETAAVIIDGGEITIETSDGAFAVPDIEKDIQIDSGMTLEAGEDQFSAEKKEGNKYEGENYAYISLPHIGPGYDPDGPSGPGVGPADEEKEIVKPDKPEEAEHDKDEKETHKITPKIVKPHRGHPSNTGKIAGILKQVCEKTICGLNSLLYGRR